MVLGQGHTSKTTALPKTAHSMGESVYRDCRDDETGRRWLEDLRSAEEGCLSQSYSYDSEASGDSVDY